MKDAIVLTTINIPTVLDSYLTNLRLYGHLEDTFCIVVGDHKTPAGTEEYCHNMSKQGLNVSYLGVDRQVAWLKNFPELDRIIPWNSDCRRNIGYLIAAARGAETIISIDDDNYAYKDSDFIGGHTNSNVLKAASSVNKWVNFCGFLNTNPQRKIYQRGFPYSKRWANTFDQAGELTEPIMVNQGMWLGSPDVDAVSNLDTPTQVVSSYMGHIALAKDNWAPINSQNTSFHRELLPCWYFLPPVLGCKGDRMADRYGDVWMGYFVEKVLHTTSGTVAYGQPIVEHIRNKHDYLNDLRMELGGMLVTEPLVEWLERVNLGHAESYGDAYVQLGEKLESAIIHKELTLRGDTYSTYFRKLRQEMEIWVEACSKVMKGG